MANTTPSGQISINDIHTIIGDGSSATQVSMNDSDIRARMGFSGAAISFNDCRKVFKTNVSCSYVVNYNKGVGYSGYGYEHGLQGSANPNTITTGSFVYSVLSLDTSSGGGIPPANTNVTWMVLYNDSGGGDPTDTAFEANDISRVIVQDTEKTINSSNNNSIFFQHATPNTGSQTFVFKFTI